MGTAKSLLPDLPFPSRINPSASELEAHFERLAADLKLSHVESFARWRAAGFHRLAARMYPTAEARRLVAIGEVVLWIFIVDDYLDPGMPGSDSQYRAQLPRKIGELLAGRQGSDADTDPLLACVRGFRENIVPLSTPRWWTRFAAHLTQFVESIRREATAHATGHAPDRATYLAHRQSTSGWRLLVDLVELEAQSDLPDEVIESPTCVACRTAAADVACAINDLLSLNKERQAGEQHNLVLVLQREFNCDLTEAIAQTHAWIDARLNAYLAARVRLLEAHAQVSGIESYVQGIENLMRGSVDWSMETSRYRPASDGREPSHDKTIAVLNAR